MNGMPRFVKHSWDAIKTQKELNVQDTRVMVFKSLCKETMEEALKLVELKLQILFNQTSDEEIFDFKDQALSILDEASTHYTSVSA